MLLDKVTFREECKKKLTKSSKISKLYKDKMIEKKLRLLLSKLPCKNILLYIPIGFEADITSFTKAMRKKCHIFVPFMEGVSFKIVKYRLPLKEKRFSIKEPAVSFLKHKKVDVAVVPVLGVGKDNKRVGFGKGMYDRFFENLDCKPITIFVQIEKCFNKKVATDTFDIQSDFYITPEKIYITRGKRYDNRSIHCRRRSYSGRTYRRRYPKKIGSVKI
ncbi:MAG: 5-formyltetrahydrofolate cyclo-ligase [Epsilonproteobacteria bacterium]|nr:5-formyltetrahydrofolate cyclo-ligase [Campylobacterota bacterium]